MMMRVSVRFRCGHFEEELAHDEQEALRLQRSAQHFRCVNCYVEEMKGMHGGERANAVTQK